VVVRFALTVYTRQEWIVQERKKPKTFLTNPIVTRQLFKAFLSIDCSLIALGQSRASTEYVHCCLLPILGIVDDVTITCYLQRPEDAGMTGCHWLVGT
jgi:hypothetical protein